MTRTKPKITFSINKFIFSHHIEMRSYGQELKLFTTRRTSDTPLKAPLKNNRIVWNIELHKRFLRAVEVLGLNASPTSIVYSMNVTGLNRHHVASHFQRYKKQLEKQSTTQKTPPNVVTDKNFVALDLPLAVWAESDALLSTMCGNMPTGGLLPFSGFCNVCNI